MAVKLNNLRAPKAPERAVANPNPSLGPVVSPRVKPVAPDAVDDDLDMDLDPEDRVRRKTFAS